MSVQEIIPARLCQKTGKSMAFSDFHVYNFAIDQDDMKALDSFNIGLRISYHPDYIDFQTLSWRMAVTVRLFRQQLRCSYEKEHAI